MKKILVTGLTSNLGGVEKFIVSYCEKIVSENIKIDFLITDSTCALQDQIEKMNSKIFIIKQEHFKHPIKFKKEFEQHVKKENYDAIWVNDCSLNSFHYIKLAKKIGINTRIIHSHNSKNMDNSLKGKLKFIVHLINKNKVSKYATNYWACSKLAAKFFYNKRLMDKVEIIKNGVDTEKFSFNKDVRNKYRKELGLQGKYVIGHVGRLHFQKNHMFILKIFEEYIKQNQDARLVLIGDGEEKENIEKFIKEHRLHKNVLMLGIRDDVQNIMQAIDVFILPSIFEGLPIVGVEAQCAGLPCIFSQNITKEVQLTENTYFLSIEENDIHKWVKKIGQISNKKYNREENTKRITQKGYNINEETTKLRLFFENIGE